MKKSLHLLFIGFTITALSQTPINSYYSAPDSYYDIIDPATVLNQTSGANQTWNFTNLVKVGESVDTYTVPTSGELASYPGTTTALTVTSTINANVSSNKFYTKNNGSQVSFTAFNNPNLELNYITDNALIGTFPLSYGYSNNDNVAGTFIYGGNNGTFQGTFNTSVDAYGMLNVTNAGARAFNGTVTRLKTEQNLNLSTAIFPNVGTVTLTNYNYYSSANGLLVFRYTHFNINVPLLSINQTSVSIESFVAILLGIDENNLNRSITLFPNPMKENLKIDLREELVIESVRVFDLYGKEVIKTGEEQNINVGRLPSGMYLVVVKTEKGSVSKKIIKE
ncbi:T9SS type A sorting domain-containing protein [Flavobacterium amniphilum]|uniref:T9SS type A sorting domain-containing protein n=1 Tax=Flavobacterium amniphilum TaxID=1834035 RepID=UPI00202A25B9|nr:T9SS type A sorting domain-containing protein [Flavobacterium amniphilum]MCL9804770.1 T9SS type A sorting domain-containing protein [Flavobacterium amniphilum]